MTPVRRALAGIAYQPWALLIVVALAALIWWAIASRTQEHHVRVAFPSAVQLTTGLPVAIDGIEVGKISEVDYADGQAVVALGIDDEDAWPLRRGTTAQARFGTTIGNATRRIDLKPGPASAPAIPEDGIIARKHTRVPVEFDQLFDTFDAPTRADLRRLAQGGSDALAGEAPALSRGLRDTPPALAGAAGLFGDLARDEHALGRLVATGARATRTLASRRDQISGLIDVAARTFTAFGTRSERVRASIERLAPALHETRGTFARLDRSIGLLDGLFADLTPGARRLPGFLGRARPALRTLARVAPIANRAVGDLYAAAPAATRLAADATPLARRLDSAFGRLAPAFRCLRPYTPEMVAFFSTWGSFPKNHEGGDDYARILLKQSPSTITSWPTDSATYLKLIGNTQRYAMPRPPGLNAGKPRFVPECGVTRDALDPAKDPEAR